MTAFYNEIDPVAAQWLRNLIEAGHIAPGVVDERSIEDIKPDELMGYTQCHFFAGIGVWSLALRRAGWPDHKPVWTGSCPCQPFSASGKQSGFDDERHLWPAFHWLIQQCSPGVVIGEQVASKAAEPWLDLVQADLEALGHAFGALAFPSASVGAPHIRDRSYWVGYADQSGSQGLAGNGGAAGWQGADRPTAEAGVSGRLANLHSNGCQSRSEGRQAVGFGQAAESDSGPERMADNSCNRRGEECSDTGGVAQGNSEKGDRSGLITSCSDSGAGPTNGFWGAADWLLCRDGKWRPVRSGTFPLAHGAAARVGRLRAYGNAINAEQATIFIEAVMAAVAVEPKSQEQAA